MERMRKLAWMPAVCLVRLLAAVPGVTWVLRMVNAAARASMLRQDAPTERAVVLLARIIHEAQERESGETEK